MSQLWNGFRDLFVDALEILHSLFGFAGDEAAWGFAIIALTLFVRILLLPLAIKQTRSMRAMQQLQPKVKAIQKKYKADRDLMKKDPERYKAQRQKMNEEMSALYKEAGVNPAGGCLPLVAQAPIFIALFSVLRAPLESHPSGTALGDLLRSDFYFFTPDQTGLSTGASSSGFWGIALIILMAGSMFWSQRQMMSRTAATADGAQLQQQKIMMYAMPVFLAAISFNFPMGVLLYWVTTNVWQIAQQAIVLHEVEDHPATPESAPSTTGAGASSGKGSTGPKPKGNGKGDTGPSSTTPTSGGAKRGPKGGGKSARPGKGASGNGASTSKQGPTTNGKPAPKRTGSSDHLPTRRSRGERG